jgi:hypothetical protein
MEGLRGTLCNVCAQDEAHGGGALLVGGGFARSASSACHVGGEGI